MKKGKVPSIFQSVNETNNLQEEIEVRTVELCMENSNDALDWNFCCLDSENNGDRGPGLDFSDERQPDLNENILISKTKYNELVEQSVVIQKLQESIKQKCARINELTKVISQHKYLLKKVSKERQQETINSSRENQTKKPEECSVSIRQICAHAYEVNSSDICLFLYFKGEKTAGNIRMFTFW